MVGAGFPVRRPARAIPGIFAVCGGPLRRSGAYGLAASSDGNYLYAAEYYGGVIAVFSRDGTTGRLTFVEVQKEGVGGVEGLDGAVAVEVSPDNRHVYVAGSLEDSVVVFNRDSTTDALTFQAVYTDGSGGVEGISGASAIAFGPDGYYLYAAGYYDSAVAVFSVDSDGDGVPDITEDGAVGTGSNISSGSSGGGCFVQGLMSYPDAS